MKHLSKYRLQVNWEQILLCVAVLLVSSIAVMWGTEHMVSPPPDFGFASEAEAAQYGKLAQHHGGWEGLCSVILILPACTILALSLVGASDSVCLIVVKKYVVLSTLVASSSMAIGIKVNESMIDWLGHVNYIETQRNIDCCRDAIMESIGWSIEKLRDEHRLAFMVSEVRTKYRHQILKGDYLQINGSLEQTTPTRIELAFNVLLPERGNALAVESRLTMPLVSLETGRPIPIPEWLKNTWERKLT